MRGARRETSSGGGPSVLRGEVGFVTGFGRCGRICLLRASRRLRCARHCVCASWGRWTCVWEGDGWVW